MSGFVVGFGNPDKDQIKSMFDLIEHRGTYASGNYKNNKVTMIQNYLKADGLAAKGGDQIPVASSWNKNLRICYDGQMGNWNDLPTTEIISEEHSILECYKESGNDMFRHLADAIFAFVISDGQTLFAARDTLGIKTLFYGRKGDSIYLASELKSITKITDEVYEFPAGHYMTADGEFVRFAKLPPAPKEYPETSLEEIVDDIKSIIALSIIHRVDFSLPTASLLSGGIDSSVICAMASELYKKKFGADARLKTFSLGVGESEDIKCARIMAEHLGTEHHEVIVDLVDLLLALPEVIYYLEHFDPSLVRSSVSNFLISRFAKENGIEVLLSGEGGDEVFCGYSHLKSMPAGKLYDGQIEILEFLHNNASLRLDRMNLCNSIKVVTPLISGQLLDYSLMNIPPEYKIKEENGRKMEKWIFRKAFEELLPDEIVWRLKQEFSQGSGAAASLPGHFEKSISNSELEEAQAKFPIIRSKEELYYFRIFTKNFGEGKAVDTVGQWLSL